MKLSKHGIVVYGFVLIVVMISFFSIGLIWKGVKQIEQQLISENRQLSESIAMTAGKFMQAGQHLYFYELLKLLSKISFVDYLEVNVEGRKIIDLNRILSLNEKWIETNKTRSHVEYHDEKTKQYYVNQAFDSSGKKSILTMVFSKGTTQKSIRLIQGAIAMIVALLIVILWMLWILRRTLLKLEAARENKAATIYSITHDARQDLTVIQGKLNTMLRNQTKGQDQSDLVRNIKTANESTIALDRFLQNLNDQQRMEQGKVELLFRETDMHKMIKSVVAEFEENMALRNICLEYSAQQTDVWVWADPYILKRILQNLVHNAMKYSGQGKNIRIELTVLLEKVRVLVSDQGIGIEKVFWEKIFQPNFQVNSNSEGMGLGLHNARALSRQMKGDVGILESKMNQGTIFYMDIPKISEQPLTVKEE